MMQCNAMCTVQSVRRISGLYVMLAAGLVLALVVAAVENFRGLLDRKYPELMKELPSV